MATQKDRTLAAYSVPGALFLPSELVLEPGLSELEWMTCLQKLDRVHESSGWWIGDCLNYGIKTFGRRVAYDLIVQQCGLSEEMLRVYSRICAKVPPERRRPGVAIMYYRIVESFPPEKQDALIAEAQELGLRSRDFVTMVRNSDGSRAVPWNERRKRLPSFPGGKHSIRIFLDRELYNELHALCHNTAAIEELVTQVMSDYLRASRGGE
jgi:hypothetical protein